MSQPRPSGHAGQLGLAWGFVVGGITGLLAAGVLLVERFRLSEDSAYTPSCSLNPVLSCGSIMESAQAAVLGFPNPVIGVAAFPVLITTGLALLAGARLRRWYWLGLQAGVTAGWAFVCWLIFQSLYRIGALCPYCMVVWSVVIPTFVYLTLHNAAVGHFGARVASAGTTAALSRWHATVLLLAFAIPVFLITVRFWYYWSTLV